MAHSTGGRFLYYFSLTLEKNQSKSYSLARSSVGRTLDCYLVVAGSSPAEPAILCGLSLTVES